MSKKVKIPDEHVAIHRALHRLLDLAKSYDIPMAGSLSFPGNLIHFDNQVPSVVGKFNNVRKLVGNKGALSPFLVEASTVDTILEVHLPKQRIDK
ncbi:hypothetical protein [Vibrio marisflavi]|uniref:Uncharacterized protein n=1 Tax=Vibrio marisflavi CECT 7928 TaxID=634439 RepID=A0ABN8E185_9VIBR|nr:hypothetical protein [Vibrio marisflavi]CAH0535999.1 hypothetical protein VMF7928_00094 [Vibrio marisflavi CECT 7928]